VLCQFQPAEYTCQSTANDYSIKFHRVAPFPDHTAPDIPSG
jgi:hypothetical protein